MLEHKKVALEDELADHTKNACIIFEAVFKLFGELRLVNTPPFIA